MAKTVSLRTDEVDLLIEELGKLVKKSTTHEIIKSLGNKILKKLQN